MDLWKLSRNQDAHVHSLHEDLAPRFQDRLKALGFREGESIRCLLKSPFGGPRVFQIGGSVFSLAEDIASQVMVRIHDPLSL